MQIDDVVNNIVLIPRILNEKKDVSIHKLLNRIGYFQLFNNIPEKLIYLKISQIPESIDEWIAYSEDKRTNTGYYLKKEGLEYIVGYLGDSGKYKSKRFTNKVKACATFIKNEIEDIRKLD